ncbi:hypothetical protein OIU85_008990 [Salix viminalis]|uniref:Uncharacterized protein n=1 Tax=Salix viminalis TaxID=40686 RepID=A0A9Q0NYW4_SALVM|nr:hypothetical protein OIU85_008990 [Salix viminalis]
MKFLYSFCNSFLPLHDARPGYIRLSFLALPDFAVSSYKNSILRGLEVLENKTALCCNETVNMAADMLGGNAIGGSVWRAATSSSESDKKNHHVQDQIEANTRNPRIQHSNFRRYRTVEQKTGSWK